MLASITSASSLDVLKDDKKRKTPSFTRKSQLSAKRIQAASPVESSAMIKSFLKLYAELFEAGILQTPLPLAHQCYGADEAGIAPFIVHQGGGKGNTMPSKFTTYLEDDWSVSCRL